MVRDADRAVDYAGCDAEQNHAVLCAEFCRRLLHGLFAPLAFRERRHRRLARRPTPTLAMQAIVNCFTCSSRSKRKCIAVQSNSIPQFDPAKSLANLSSSSIAV